MTSPPRAVANYRHAAQRLLHGARRQDEPLASLLTDAGLSMATLEQGEIGIQQFIALLRVLTGRLDDEFFGLAGRRAKPGTSALLMDLILGCSTLGAAIEQAANFFRILSDDVELRCDQLDEDIQLSINLAHPDLDPANFLPEYLLVYLQRLLSWSIGQMLPVRQVGSCAPTCPPAESLLYFIRHDWLAGQARNSLTFSRRYWSLPIVRTRAEWQEHHRRLVEQGELGWPNTSSQFSSQVRALLREALLQRQPLPRLQDIAEQLYMSVQTLHRQLQHEGSGYQRILDDLRRDQATDLLLKQHMSVAQAAEYLGYSETRSFSRAFKQWTGQSPSELRRQPR